MIKVGWRKYGQFLFLALALLSSDNGFGNPKTAKPTPESAKKSDESVGGLDNYLDAAIKIFLDSPAIKGIQTTQKANIDQMRSIDEQAPWTLDSEVSHSLFQSDPVALRALASQRQQSSTTIKNTLSHTLRNSLTTSISAEVATTKYQAEALEPDMPSSVGVQIAYDLVQGGRDGQQENNARLAIKQVHEEQQSLRSQNLEEKIKLAGLAIEFLATICKINELNLAQKLITETIEVGRVQLSTKTISYKDFLNFNDLDNSFLRRKANLEVTLVSLIERLGTYSEGMRTWANGLQKANLKCEGSTAPINGKIDKLLSGSSIESWVKVHPGFVRSTIGSERAALQVRRAELINRPELGPFASYQISKNALTPDPLGVGTVGVRLKWNFQQTKGTASVASAEATRQAAKEAVSRDFFSLRSRMMDLAVRAESQKNISAVIEKSLANLNELVKTLEVQKRLGTTDSLNFANSYLNRIDSIHALIDTWATLYKIHFELREYSIQKPYVQSN